MSNVLNQYLPRLGTITKCVVFPHDKKLFRINANLFFIPGQFVELSVEGIGEFPVSITSAPFEKEYFEICVKKIGRVTEYLNRYSKGDIIGFRGPFGNGFPMDVIKGKNVAVIAGGIGILPLRSFIREVMNSNLCKSLTILYGAKEPKDMLFRDEFAEWKENATVIDVYERNGNRLGLASEYIEHANLCGNEIVFVCGPPGMFNPVGKSLEKIGICDDNIFVSLERRMKCGVGKCGHCIVDGQYYTCKDGPVLPYSKYRKIIV